MYTGPKSWGIYTGEASLVYTGPKSVGIYIGPESNLVYTGPKTWESTQVPKPGKIVPEVGTPEDPDEGITGPQIGVWCCIVSRPRREIIILN